MIVLDEWADEGETSRERPIAPLHLHRSEDEGWYVLAGRLGLRLSDEEVEAEVGESVVAEAGIPHSYWNAGFDRTRYVIVMGAGTAALVEAIHAMDPFDPARLPALFEDHDSELLA